MHRVTLLFDDVRDLHLRGFSSSPMQIMGFDILSVDCGSEGTRFEIEDYENGLIGFNCREVTVLHAEEVDAL